MRRVVFLCSLVLVGACSRACDNPKDPQPAAIPPLTVDAAPLIDAANVVDASLPKKGAMIPATASDKEAHRAFVDAMKRGRELTRAKKYEEAVAAFDEALKKEPGSAQAEAERGYAKLVKGDDEGARSDLERASAKTKDPRLLAQIWFNLGLANEKSGLRRSAHIAFANSNDLVPSASAKTKADATADAKDDGCGVHLSTGGVTGEVTGRATGTRAKQVQSFSGWLAAYRGLSHFEEPQKDPPTSDDAARKVLESECAIDDGALNRMADAPEPAECHGTLDVGGVTARVIIWQDGWDKTMGIALVEGGTIWVIPSINRMTGRCGPPSVEIDLARSGPFIRVRVLDAWTFATSVCKTKEPDDAGDFPLGECDEGHTEHAGSGCTGTNEFDREDAFIDPKKHALAFTISGFRRPNGDQHPRRDFLETKAEVSGDSIIVTGAACTQTIPLPRGK